MWQGLLPFLPYGPVLTAPLEAKEADCLFKSTLQGLWGYLNAVGSTKTFHYADLQTNKQMPPQPTLVNSITRNTVSGLVPRRSCSEAGT